jgi:hypothetical protein
VVLKLYEAASQENQEAKLKLAESYFQHKFRNKTLIESIKIGKVILEELANSNYAPAQYLFL